ncbi:MAG: transposase domain-containing protein [Terriglobales bacterium]
MTCRANEVEPYAYLNYLFEHLPAASTVEQVETLLPWNVKTMLEEQKKSQQRHNRRPPDASARYPDLAGNASTGLIEP